MIAILNIIADWTLKYLGLIQTAVAFAFVVFSLIRFDQNAKSSSDITKAVHKRALASTGTFVFVFGFLAFLLQVVVIVMRFFDFADFTTVTRGITPMRIMLTLCSVYMINVSYYKKSKSEQDVMATGWFGTLQGKDKHSQENGSG